MMRCVFRVSATEKMAKVTDKLFFMIIVLYLPFSIFWVFWLYLVSIIFLPESWQYQLFYGQDGNAALVWLLAMLLPALLFLILKARGKKFASRLTGATGFYCLLASLISTHHILALPGVIFIVVSVVISRQLKKLSR